MGDIGKKSAEAICQRVTQLADLADAGLSIDGELSAWLDKIGQGLSDKLATAGLIRERQSATLAGFVDAYLASRQDMKHNSIRIYRTARDRHKRPLRVAQGVVRLATKRVAHTVVPHVKAEHRTATQPPLVTTSFRQTMRNCADVYKRT